METQQPRAWTDIDLEAIRGAMEVLDVSEGVDSGEVVRLRAELEALRQEHAHCSREELVQVPYPVFDTADTARIEGATLEWKRACEAFSADIAPRFIELGRIADEFWKRIEEGMDAAKGTSARQAPAPAQRPKPAHNMNGKMTPGAQRMLITLARRHPTMLNARDLGALSGVKHSGGSFGPISRDCAPPVSFAKRANCWASARPA